MTKEEFIQRFRGRMLLFVSEAWAIRRVVSSEAASVMDAHHLEMRRLLDEMYDAMVEKKQPIGYTSVGNGNGVNGHHRR